MANSRSPLLYSSWPLPVVYLLALVGFPIVYNMVMSVQEVTIGNIVDFCRPVRRPRELSAGARRPGRSARSSSIRSCSSRPTWSAQVGIGLWRGAVLLAAVPRRALSARPAARVLDAAGARGRRVVEMDVRHRVWRRQFRRSPACG